MEPGSASSKERCSVSLVFRSVFRRVGDHVVTRGGACDVSDQNGCFDVYGVCVRMGSGSAVVVVVVR